jgi:hypothetical protein
MVHETAKPTLPTKCVICGGVPLPFHILCDMCRVENGGYALATYKPKETYENR